MGLADGCGGGRTGRWLRLSAIGLFERTADPHILGRSWVHTGPWKRRPHLKFSSQCHSEGSHANW